jgi:hypothetical protein
MHPVVTVGYWLLVARPHHVDTALKVWKEATLHGLPLLVLIFIDFFISNRRFVGRWDWLVPTSALLGYGGWMQVAAWMHPEGGKESGPWYPYPLFAPGSPRCWLYYGVAVGAINVVFYGVYRAHQWKARRFDDHLGWARRARKDSG